MLVDISPGRITHLGGCAPHIPIFNACDQRNRSHNHRTLCLNPSSIVLTVPHTSSCFTSSRHPASLQRRPSPERSVARLPTSLAARRSDCGYYTARSALATGHLLVSIELPQSPHIMRTCLCDGSCPPVSPFKLSSLHSRQSRLPLLADAPLDARAGLTCTPPAGCCRCPPSPSPRRT